MTPVETKLMSLEEVAKNAGDLPSFPATAFKAMQMSEDPQVTARDLQAVIARDQAQPPGCRATGCRSRDHD